MPTKSKIEIMLSKLLLALAFTAVSTEGIAAEDVATCSLACASDPATMVQCGLDCTAKFAGEEETLTTCSLACASDPATRVQCGLDCTAKFAGDVCASVGGCAREPGFCVNGAGNDINNDITKNPNLDLPEAECLAWCKSTEGSTGCERIVNLGNKGCYVFTTKDIHHGNGNPNHWCWIFHIDNGIGGAASETEEIGGDENALPTCGPDPNTGKMPFPFKSDVVHSGTPHCVSGYFLRDKVAGPFTRSPLGLQLWNEAFDTATTETACAAACQTFRGSLNTTQYVGEDGYTYTSAPDKYERCLTYEWGNYNGGFCYGYGVSLHTVLTKCATTTIPNSRGKYCTYDVAFINGDALFSENSLSSGSKASSITAWVVVAIAVASHL